MLVERLSALVFVFACLLSVCPDKRLARPLPSDLHPSTVQLQPAKPDFQVSHPHVLDCCHLTCANIKEREGKREREREGGKERNGKISQPLVTGWGAEKNSTQLSKPSQIQEFTCALFSLLFSLLIHSLFL